MNKPGYKLQKCNKKNTGSIWERTQPTFCQVCKQWCNTRKKPETGVEFQTLDVYAHDLKNIQICFLPSEA